MALTVKNIIPRFFRKIGYEKMLSEKESQESYRLQYSKEILENIHQVKEYSMLSFLKLATLYEKVVFLEQHNIKGDLVECGVWKGGSVGIMALANLRFSKDRRKLHLFDAFDDICEPNPEIDGDQALKDVEQLLGHTSSFTGKLTPIKGIYDVRGGHGTIKECRDLLVNKIAYNEEYVLFHKGWFQETLPSITPTINKIALLRLDADWYESTKICLDYLFDKVVKGGFVIIDDYGRYDGCKKAVDEFLEKKELKVFLNYSDYRGGECRYFIKN